ncbi:MAG: type II toxin-antitoxin system HicA family toxin [Polaribacter sp.]
MGKNEKLWNRFCTIPNNFTWIELIKVLNYKGYFEMKKTGKTRGSRGKFVDENKNIINLHKPHPNNIVKQYVIKKTL